MDTATQPRTKTILLVDDNDVLRITAKWFLGNFGYEIQTARSGEDGLALFDPNRHDLVITDNSMPGISGTEMALVIKSRSASTPILMYTGNPPADRSAVDEVILRPTHLLLVKEAVDRLLAERSAATPA